MAQNNRGLFLIHTTSLLRSGWGLQSGSPSLRDPDNGAIIILDSASNRERVLEGLIVVSALA